MGTCQSNFSDSLEVHVPSQCTSKERHPHVPQSMKINVLSYNIFIRPPFINTNGDDYKCERLDEFGKIMDTFDVICLQEMFSSYSSRRSDLLKQAKEKGFLYYSAAPKYDFFSKHLIDAGLLILSKFPIEESEFRPFPSGIGSDSVVQKGVLYVKIAIGTSKLHLYTTHTQATYDEDIKYFLQRTEQFITFRNFIHETLEKYEYSEEDMVLLAGDFNVDSRSKNYVKNNLIKYLPMFKDLPGLIKHKTFSEYHAMVSCLSDDHRDFIEDLVLKKYQEHPATFGAYVTLENGEKKPLEKVLTHPEYQCSSECLDYMLRYTPRIHNRSMTDLVMSRRAKAELTYIEDSVRIEPFFVKGHDFDQLSDHYGVAISLQYSKNIDLEKEDTDASLSSQSESLSKSFKSE